MTSSSPWWTQLSSPFHKLRLISGMLAALVHYFPQTTACFIDCCDMEHFSQNPTEPEIIILSRNLYHFLL